MRQQPQRRQPAAILGACLMGLSCLASAGQTIYRCGNSYSDAPCAGASMLAIDDSRSPAQKAQTDAATRQTRSLAQQMERERLALEKSAMSSRPPATRLQGDTPARAPGTGAPADPARTAKTPNKSKTPASPFFMATKAPDKKPKVSGGAAN